MTLKRAKDQLRLLLGQDDISVIALSGKWGTGKTHLWNEVKNESRDEKVRKSLYVSLFGLSSIDQIKRKLIEAAIPGIDSNPGVFKTLRNISRVGVSALSTHYKALAAINDINLLLMAPAVFRGKVIVIDDIERKHEKLGIDEVLGFIDEYSKQHCSRFVLVLNEDQLSSPANQDKLWATFREKVIDHEIRLSTSADEAFSIAIGLMPSKYADALKKATVACGISNIRIIGKVIRVANQILGGRELDPAIQARVIPSIVLFSAIHYRGLADGPDFKFVLAFNPYFQRPERIANSQQTPEEKHAVGWRMLMQQLGIQACDEFERKLVQYFESGLFDAASIQVIIDRYVTQRELMEARDAAHRFLIKTFWDHRADESQLVAEASSLQATASLLDPFVVTELESILKDMPGGAEVGAAILEGWITSFKSSNPVTVPERNLFNKPLHPAIQAEFAAIKTQSEANATVLDACIEVIEKGGWGTLQEVTMKKATAADFERIIREMEDLDKLRLFMHGMIDMRLQRETYEPHFGDAMEKFIEACRSISNDAGSPRLAGLIKRLFSGSSLESELALKSAIVDQAPSP